MARDMECRVRLLLTHVWSERGQVEEASGKMRAMQAEVAAKDSELAMIKEEAKRWETRSQQLLQKYKSVDPKEHQRVCDQLKARLRCSVPL